MAQIVPPHFRRVRRVVPRPSSAAVLSLAALLLAVVVALLASGVVTLPEPLREASYWRWHEAVGL
jgi:hypothetical protein